MLKIRLQRVGRKHEPTFRIVLTESQNSPKSGKYLEVLGSYDARKTNEQIHADRITYWMGKGAQVSNTMHNMLIEKKIITGKKVNALPKKRPIVDEAKLKAEADAKVAAEVREDAKAESVSEPAPESTSDTTEEKVEETPVIE